MRGRDFTDEPRRRWTSCRCLGFLATDGLGLCSVWLVLVVQSIWGGVEESRKEDPQFARASSEIYPVSPIK